MSSQSSAVNQNRPLVNLVGYDDRDDTMSDISGGDPTFFADDVSMGSRAKSSIGTVSEIYPEDSASWRGQNVARHANKKGKIPLSEMSEEPSVISFDSQAEVQLLKEFYGRAFNTQTDNYLLPADVEEHSRLDVQHIASRFHIGGLYAYKPLVDNAMRPNQDPPPAVFDIGTGSGKWAVEMAIEFPYAEVVGMDIVPPAMMSRDTIPDNCRFEVDDANLSMSHYENCFNVVHLRTVWGGINDFRSLFYECARTLRPSGVLLLVDGTPDVFDENKLRFPDVPPDTPGMCWCHFIFTTVSNFMEKRNNNFTPGQDWHAWLEENPNYGGAITQDTFMELGPWKPNMSPRATMAATMMRQSIFQIMAAWKPLLMTEGYEEAVVDHWVKSAQSELMELRVHGYIRWRYSVAVRRNVPWIERTEVPEPIIEKPEITMITPSFIGSGSSGGATLRGGADTIMQMER